MGKDRALGPQQLSPWGDCRGHQQLFPLISIAKMHAVEHSQLRGSLGNACSPSVRGSAFCKQRTT